ncbi:putative cell surface glycoprotein [Natrinema thermotolerans DSM 11552]|nr:putative cell surface glycoprotein [Natrinema thermotolerans DSM 11552]
MDEGQEFVESEGADSVEIDGAPAISNPTPSDGTVTNDANQSYTVALTDEASGVDADSIAVSVENNGSAVVADAGIGDDNVTYDSGSGTLSLEPAGYAYEDGTVTVTVDVADNAGHAATQYESSFVVDTVSPTPTIDLRNEAGVTVSSGSTLDITYDYLETNTQNVTVTLEGETYNATGQAYTYEIDDGGYISDASKSVILDLDEQRTTPGDLADGAYSVTIEATDTAGNTNSTSTDGAPVVVDDNDPELTAVVLNTTEDVAPGDTVDVTYDYADATNATDLRLELFDPDSDETYVISEAVEQRSGTDLVQTFDLSDAAIDDNTDYEVTLVAADSVDWTSDSADSVTTVDVNAAAPSISSVEANAGQDAVTVTFSEGIGDRLDRTDFAYQDVSGDGATAIDGVTHTEGGTTARLTLDNEVAASDLGTDVITVRSGEVPDTATGEERYVDSSETVALQDTTAPSVAAGDVVARAIDQSNDDSYSVEVDLTEEIVDVGVTVTGTNGAEVSGSVNNATGYTTISSLNVSALEDSDSTTVTVRVTDKGGNTETATVHRIEKDTVSPSIDSVQANAGTDTISVTFDEAMSNVGPNAFNLDGVDATIVAVDGAGSGANTYDVTLDSPLSFDEINTSNATIVAPGATDTVGNPAVEVPAQLNDNENPSVEGLDASANDMAVTVQFSEGVVNASGEALTAADFVYTDNSGDNASAIESVDHTATSTTAVVTLDAAVTVTDLGTDELGIASDAVYDANGSAASAANYTLEDSMAPDVELSTAVDGETITYTLTSNEELDAIEVDLETQNDLVIERGPFSRREPVDEELTAEDFDQQATETGYVYTATYTAPRDGRYDTYLRTATDIAGNDAKRDFTYADVDTEDPAPIDAMINPRSNDEVAILFDEPVDVRDVGRDDVSVEGGSVDYLSSGQSGYYGIMMVDLYDPLQTGDKPNVTIRGDSFTEITNDSSRAQTVPTTVHTTKLQLNEGTNFVSVPAISGGQDLDELDTSNVDVIWSYTGDSWEKYDPDDPESDFDSLEGGQGYIVEMETADTLDINVYNRPASSTGDIDGAVMNQQQLEEGWNLIGHYQTEEQSAFHALRSIDDEFHMAYGQSTGYAYELVHPDDPLNAGEAYWVFVKDDTVYTHAPSEPIRPPDPIRPRPPYPIEPRL